MQNVNISVETTEWEITEFGEEPLPRKYLKFKWTTRNEFVFPQQRFSNNN